VPRRDNAALGHRSNVVRVRARGSALARASGVTSGALDV
jgi:hypothetical protein